ncbi:hypothetical protein O4J56_07760 [Nocardiopsis sp. RSe5-2]|uniref:Transposase DDE domain-containing protein n=1 Tax=Nocardiopsis endophytica TaxID=3018445 RepID=A0ABT4U228_9ACTN|nr:hypothetical protein [Nocardiopsis endophytica]MDA2810530.1 hypothetical protein [Nocardiopsis endophytica]
MVERTFAWLGKFQRTSKDYEYRPVISENVLCLAMGLILVRRMARATPCPFSDALYSAKLTITQPREIAQYAHAFERLRQAAVYGRAARELITRAADETE